ncbi:MAG TPA: hypothetical protein DD625_00905 [Leuconostoc mesenteroides]|nr:hypothetical protein [Leuconostoc mesenteroides]
MKCTTIPETRECFQWFSSLKSVPEWVSSMPNWAIQKLDNGYWIVQEGNMIAWYNNEEFHEIYDLVENDND